MIKIANIELVGAQHIYTDDQHHLIEQQLPGSQVAVLQDLGRRSTKIYIKGLVWGQKSLEQLASLHKLQLDAKPVSFVADIINGLPLRQVFIREVKVSQDAGYKDYYRYAIALCEVINNKTSSTGSTVNKNAINKSNKWAGNATATSASANPSALVSMSASKAADSMVASAKVDPSKTMSMLSNLQASGGLGAMVEDFAGSNLNLADQLKNLKLPIDLQGMIGDFTACINYVKDAKDAMGKFGTFSKAMPEQATK